MLIVLLRHADKLARPEDDPDLSPQGHEQAQELTNLLGERLPVPDRMWSSPKRRSLQTLEHLSRATEVKAEIIPELDERKSQETTQDFTKRVRRLVDSLTNPIKVANSLILCSHADWLAEAILALPSDLREPEFETPFINCQFRIFEWEDGIWHLKRK